LTGLVAPHAGLFFSGHVAGTAFANLRPNTFDTVILIGPDHRGAAPGQISTVQVNAWRTPLGDIPVDWDILEAIQPDIDLELVPTDDEHSLEIELPFLQMTLQEFKLVPLIMGNQTPQMCRRLGAALVKVSGDRQDVLLVASSDLSHFFEDDIARYLDKTTLQFVLDLDGDGLIEHVEAGRRRGEPLACGAGPIAAIIHAAKALGASRAHLLKYATSADVYPSKDSVVGYAAIAISI
jgi:AmmeMemoRadiSam system protein B